MAILIVDDEQQTREALRHLLVELSYKVILEAKNGEEACRILDTEKSRIQMIISNLEMPHGDGLSVAREVQNRRNLDLAPFILMTSDFFMHLFSQHRRMGTMRRKTPRIDECIRKPFQLTALSKAIQNALVQRSSHRNQILFLGSNIPPAIKTVSPSQPLHSWKSIIEISNLEKASQTLRHLSSSFGTIFLDPNSFTEVEQISLSRDLAYFKKTPLGTLTPLICLSDHPKELFHFRTLCQFYFSIDAIAESQIHFWKQTLFQIRVGLNHHWEVDLLLQKVKIHLQEKNYPLAQTIIKKMLRLNPFSAETYCLAGDIYEHLGNHHPAIDSFEQSIHLNPTLPRPYLRLFNLSYPEEYSLAEKAVQFCPHHQGVLFATAKIFLKSGDRPKVRRNLESILKLNPNHFAAKTILESTLPSDFHETNTTKAHAKL